MIKFCGFTIKPLKVVKVVKEVNEVKDAKDVKEEKIILSTWSQPASVGGTFSIYASDVSEFLDGFIGNIETLLILIKKLKIINIRKNIQKNIQKQIIIL